MDIETLWSGEYVDLVSPEKYPYEAVHPSDSVIALPVLDGDYIIRKEVCPPYMVKDEEGREEFWTVVSGGIDEGETPLQTLKREMGEETGIVPQRIRVIQKREQSPYHKITTQRVSLYFFDILEYDKVEATGDGTVTEDLSETHRVSYDELLNLSEEPNADLLLYLACQCARNYENDIY